MRPRLLTQFYLSLSLNIYVNVYFNTSQLTISSSHSPSITNSKQQPWWRSRSPRSNTWRCLMFLGLWARVHISSHGKHTIQNKAVGERERESPAGEQSWRPKVKIHWSDQPQSIFVVFHVTHTAEGNFETRPAVWAGQKGQVWVIHRLKRALQSWTSGCTTNQEPF